MKFLMRLICPVLILLLWCSHHCYAQANEDYDDFVPRENVIFYDDFSTDASNAFPAHWYIQPCCNAASYTSVRLCHTTKTDASAMVIAANDKPAESTTDNLIEPHLKEKHYLPDSFTLQYDFLPGDETGSACLFFHTSTPTLISCMIYNKDSAGPVVEIANNSMTYIAHIINEFDYSKWHHLALSYYKRKLTCYIDDERILAIRDCHFEPFGFMLSADKGRVSYTNVRLATGKYLIGDHYNFGKLFTAKKFVTHAIYFDVKAATIRPGSTGFIKTLATWLNQNRGVKLEIDGHTDNDGTPAANIKLSQDRADEVRKQLVLQGVNATRLTTKGYGDTKPIQPNTTPDGKAENRRVEFIRQ